MGRLFMRHPGGYQVYVCKTCSTPLANDTWKLSTNFISPSGPAMLMKHAINLNESRIFERTFTTGDYSVRDLICRRCDIVAGWLYEHVPRDDQKYKLGKAVLICAMIAVVPGYSEPCFLENKYGYRYMT